MKMRCVEKHLLIERPEHYQSEGMQKFIENEIKRPSKQWIGSVLDGSQEKEHVKLDTDTYLLLPDTERVNRYWTQKKINSDYSKSITVNWLAIVKDPSLRTIRDLRGEHIPMLQSLQKDCLKKITDETGVPQDKIMVYFHYHPSIYHLHIHFAYPYMQYNQKDILRIHPVDTIINNLSISSEYYANACLPVSCNKDSILYKVILNSQEKT